jgi:hypothetical protein
LFHRSAEAAAGVAARRCFIMDLGRHLSLRRTLPFLMTTPPPPPPPRAAKGAGAEGGARWRLASRYEDDSRAAASTPKLSVSSNDVRSTSILPSSSGGGIAAGGGGDSWAATEEEEDLDKKGGGGGGGVLVLRGGGGAGEAAAALASVIVAKGFGEIRRARFAPVPVVVVRRVARLLLAALGFCPAKVVSSWPTKKLWGVSSRKNAFRIFSYRASLARSTDTIVAIHRANWRGVARAVRLVARQGSRSRGTHPPRSLRPSRQVCVSTHPKAVFFK